MKRLIALAALMAVTTVNAEELKFGDLNYFLKQGQSNAIVDFNQILEKQNTKGGADIERRGYEVLARYGFGLTDQLNAYVGADYGYKNKFETKNTNSASYTNDGLSNPLVALNYRLLNQNTSGFNFDIGAVARFNIEDAERGSSNTTSGGSEDGNFADPRSSYELNIRLGNKWNEANEWQVAVGGILRQEGDYDLVGPGTKSKTDVDSSTDIYVRASYQYRPVNEFMMHVFATATQNGEVEEKTAGVKSKAEDHIDYLFGFQAKYLVTDNFIVRFNLTDALRPDYKVKSAAGNSKIENRIYTTYGLAAEFLF